MKHLQKRSVWAGGVEFSATVLVALGLLSPSATAQNPAAQNSAAVPAASLPEAAAILDHFVDVTGGKAAYEKHTTELMSGVVSFPAQGLTGKLQRYGAPPETEYSVIELPQIGKIESGVTRGVAWDKSAFLGPRVKSGEERNQALREAAFNGTVDWRAIYAKVETVGVEAVTVEAAPAEECYKVVLTPKTGNAETRFYSKTSGLLLKTTTNAVSPMGDVAVEVSVSNYRNFDGVLYPVRSKQTAGGQQLEITLTNIVFNDPLPQEYATLPTDIQALLPKGAPAKSAK